MIKRKETLFLTPTEEIERINKGKKLIDEYLEKYFGSKSFNQRLLDLYAVEDAKRYVAVSYSKELAVEFNKKLEKELSDYAKKRIKEKEEEKNVSKKFSTDDNILFNDVPPDLKQEFDKTENNNLKFALAVAIAGRHHTAVFSNSYYCWTNAIPVIETGFQMLLPRLSAEESSAVSRIYSLAGQHRQDLYERPVRMPYKACTSKGMFGAKLSPGEAALAHNGVLFLEDAAEFRTSVLQMLRVYLSTENTSLRPLYPSKAQLFMMTSPCPCGNFGSKEKLCLCSGTAIETFRKKIMLPLGDRLAISINTNTEDNSAKNFTLEELRNFISTAWKRQLHRQGKLNQDLSLDEAFALKISDKARVFFKEATEDFSVGRKAEILKLAQTLNDISDGPEELQEEHIAEAVKLNAKI